MASEELVERLRELAAHHRKTMPALEDDFVFLGDEAADLIESLSLRMRRMEEALRQIAEERVWGLEITTEDLRDIARAALTQ